jgi:alcohol dehydrogenase
VVGVDVDERKLQRAGELGADAALRGGPDVVDEVRELTGGGVDYAFEAAGVAAAFAQAYAVTRRGGTPVAIGLADPAAQVPLRPADLVAGERGVRGSYMGSTVPERDIPRYVALMRAGRLPLARLVGERLTLDDVPAAMRRLHDDPPLRARLGAAARAAVAPYTQQAWAAAMSRALAAATGC